MFKIDSNQTIRMSPGDDVLFPLFVNVGSIESPVRYSFSKDRGDSVYFALYKINDEFPFLEKEYKDNGEIITYVHKAKKSTIHVDDLINDNCDFVLRLAHEDTQFIPSGEYRYEIKGKLTSDETADGYKHVTITNKLPLVIVADGMSSADWSGTSLSYVYGRLNEIVKAAQYSGVNTNTANTTVNNSSGTIRVDNIIEVPDTPVPGQFVTSVKQHDGAIHVERSTIPEEAIPELPKEKIQGLDEVLAAYQPKLTFAGEYSPASNPVATTSYVKDSISSLDTEGFALNRDETVAFIKETDGIVSVTKQGIKIDQSKVEGLTDALEDISKVESEDIKNVTNRLNTLDTKIESLNSNTQFSQLEIPTSIKQTNGQISVDKREINRNSFENGFFSIAQVEGLSQRFDDTDAEIVKEAAERIAAISSVSNKIEQLKTEVSDSVPAEILTRIEEDKKLSNRINTEVSERKAADQVLQEAISDEISVRETSVKKLNEDLSKLISDEVDAREAADTSFTSSLQAEARVRNTADIAEKTARQEADSAIRQSVVDEINNRISSVQETKEELERLVSSEAAIRDFADKDLQRQIDTIEQKTDVVDVVSTYAELQAYPSKHPELRENSIVKVLTDEKHLNATSYYRWSGLRSWEYLGSLGPFYTKAETDNKLDLKADKVAVYTKEETTALFEDVVRYDDNEDIGIVEINADQLNGHPDTYFAVREDTLDALSKKVDKVSGKVLSDNNYTTAEKNKLASLENYDDTGLALRVSVIEAKEPSWDAKQDAISDLQTIRQGSALGATSVQPAAISDMATKTWVNEQGYITVHQDISHLQPKSDNSLTTTAKTVVGAINENKGNITSVNGRVSAVEGMIPTQASSTNQLADKEFVNSSIATNTAQFRGSYDVVDDLHLTQSATHEQVQAALKTVVTTVTNNDYVFVWFKNASTGVTERYDRYKYSVQLTSWQYEYTLNNSSFTAEQWQAINSGVSAEDVALAQSAYQKPANGIPKSDLSSGIQTSLGKADSALQSHQSLAAYRTSSAQDVIDAKKVDKVSGKGLSTNDYDNTEKQNVASNTAARHSHSNKSILDTITQAMLDLIGTISSKYVKPTNGIPKSDLASAVQTSLSKADTALQSYNILYTVEEG